MGMGPVFVGQAERWEPKGEACCRAAHHSTAQHSMAEHCAVTWSLAPASCSAAATSTPHRAEPAVPPSRSATGGHIGYELAPFIPSMESLLCLLWNGTARPSGALNTVRHHDMHHRYPNKHFSLYFTHWDR